MPLYTLDETRDRDVVLNIDGNIHRLHFPEGGYAEVPEELVDHLPDSARKKPGPTPNVNGGEDDDGDSE